MPAQGLATECSAAGRRLTEDSELPVARWSRGKGVRSHPAGEPVPGPARIAPEDEPLPAALERHMRALRGDKYGVRRNRRVQIRWRLRHRNLLTRQYRVRPFPMCGHFPATDEPKREVCSVSDPLPPGDGVG
ncbi:hypothetical protein GCM10010260_17530 [Streptomyces filipinensis]|uniref:Uncharacterized protein n=1 Tax=Streptomyces filipinensis TaxID=66887 RepID=A0A918I8F4_9ACTN|nr:hypothetical protein GCM10010260_17530 [Streptomyces filipinensis]